MSDQPSWSERDSQRFVDHGRARSSGARAGTCTGEGAPDDYNKPSRPADQLHRLEQAGIVDVGVAWMLAGHAIFGGRRKG